ncbi:MAG: hypothetical protein IKF41_03165 [Alphaproteobacteria bacterium]|nr:hypothetical protein [Alphaproteobacteria bacterium]
MKKILGISLVAVLTAMPLIAGAAVDTADPGATVSTNAPVAQNAPKYGLAPADATNDGKFATAGYVKGAYNAAIKAVNKTFDDAKSYADGLAGNYANTTLGNVTAGSVTTGLINNGAVTTDKLGADAVTNAKLADNAVQTENIVDANVTAAKLATDSVTTAKIADGNVTKAKLATAVQNSLDLADGAVQSVAEGTANGTVSVDGTDIAVHGLGTAAYTDSSAYDAAGAAATAEQNAKGYAEDYADENKVAKDSIASTLTGSSTNEQVAGAKAVYDADTALSNRIKTIEDEKGNYATQTGVTATINSAIVTFTPEGTISGTIPAMTDWETQTADNINATGFSFTGTEASTSPQVQSYQTGTES